MLDLLDKGKRIINIDESWLNESNFVHRAWCRKDGSSNFTIKPLGLRISVIAAIDTEGKVWYALTQVNTVSSVIEMFLHRLVKLLDQQEPGWSESTVIMMDNASYHASKATKTAFEQLGLTVIYSAPYSYTSAPVETLFALLKHGDINPRLLPSNMR
tara:strand:- start:186 stop:656 length:471 start_codon:yes stop_codon:yes gene_type:complete